MTVGRNAIASGSSVVTGCPDPILKAERYRYSHLRYCGNSLRQGSMGTIRILTIRRYRLISRGLFRLGEKNEFSAYFIIACGSARRRPCRRLLHELEDAGTASDGEGLCGEFGLRRRGSRLREGAEHDP